MGQKRICDITPLEFEKFCCDVLAGYAEEENIRDFKITHNKIIKAPDGKYQIDVYAEFTVMGAQFKVLCECKRYKYRVNREKVAVLHRKLESVGAHKGILISTSDFQSGAIEYGKAHGIALIKAEEYPFEYLSHSSGQPENDENDPFLYAEKRWPPYVAFDFTANSEKPYKVYPTRAAIRKLLLEQNEKIKEVMGIDIYIDFPEM